MVQSIGNFLNIFSYLTFIKLGKSVKNIFLITMTAYPGVARPIVRSPMGIPITAGCDKAWIIGHLGFTDCIL